MAAAMAGRQWGEVGERIRLERKAEGISVRELARRIGVSASHVSQVERGIGSFSVPALYAVAEELKLPMSELLGPIDGEAPPGPAKSSEPIVLRQAARSTIQLSDGPRWMRLTPTGEVDSEFLEVVYSPTNTRQDRLIRHAGREYGVIIEGELHVEVDGVPSVLKAGDSIAFDSSRPHRFWNESGREVRAIWFVRGRLDGESAPHA